jgi:pimeloyl-ACP methyl ester carboxylesterase
MAKKRLLVGAALAAAPIAAAGPLARLAIDRFEALTLADVDPPGRRMRIDGVSVRYIDEGHGFPVVLLHGFGGSAFDFRTLLPALTDRFRVVAVDLPGFGYSDRDVPEISSAAWIETLVGLLSELHIERAVFVGHSMGGGVVQRFADAHPEKVERLVLVDSVSAAERRRAASLTAPVSLIATIVQGGIALFGGANRLLDRTVADPSRLTPTAREGHLEPLRIRGSAAAVRQMLADSAREEPIDLTRLTMPVLLLWGEQDRVVKLNVAERLLGTLPNARIEVVPDAGHLVLEEQPEAANRIVLAFLDDLAARPVTRNGAASHTHV